MQDYLQALHTENLICRTVPPTLFARLLAAQPCPLADVEIGDINALDPGGDIADYNLCALLLDGLSAGADVIRSSPAFACGAGRRLCAGAISALLPLLQRGKAKRESRVR